MTAPERPNSRITASPITNGGVMIGSTVSTRSARLARKSVRVAISAKARPSSVVPAPTRTASSSEFQATPQLTRLCRQASPQILAVEQLGEEARGRERAGVVLQRADQDLGDREEDEGGDQRDDQADRADHEHVAVDRAARRDPAGQQEQEGRADQQPAVAHAELAVVERPEAGSRGRRTASRGCRSRSPAAGRSRARRARSRSGSARTRGSERRRPAARAAPAAAARSAPATTCR